MGLLGRRLREEKKNVGEVSADNVDEYAAQFAASLQPDAFLKIRGTQGARRGDILLLNGVHALRFIIETRRFEAVDPNLGCIVLYTLYEQDRVHNVYFIGPRGRANDLVAASERTMATLRMPPAPLTRFGAPRWLRKTIQLTKFALLALAVLAPFGIAALLLERRKRRAATAR